MTFPKNHLTDGQLLLVPATIQMLEAELAHKADLVFELLKVPSPPYWPPDLNDNDSFSHFLNVQQTVPNSHGWGAYYVLTIQEGRALIGSGGFIAPPDEDGAVEIGYSILSQYRRMGFATRLARLLVEFAFRDHRVTNIIATTYPHLIGSIGVLKRLEFKFDGDREESVIAYRLSR